MRWHDICSALHPASGALKQRTSLLVYTTHEMCLTKSDPEPLCLEADGQHQPSFYAKLNQATMLPVVPAGEAVGAGSAERRSALRHLPLQVHHQQQSGVAARLPPSAADISQTLLTCSDHVAIRHCPVRKVQSVQRLLCFCSAASMHTRHSLSG